MSNRVTIDGNHNIVIQDTDNTQVTIHTSDHDELIATLTQLNEEQIVALKKLIKEQVLPQWLEQLISGQFSELIIPKQLTSLFRIAKEDIVGREADLNALRQHLINNNKLLLINGMGGIGKTTLTAVYVDTYFDDYDHIVWLTIETSLKEAIIANRDLLTNLSLLEVPPNELLSACLNRLRTMRSAQPGLLVLDNATERLAKLYDSLPGATAWHVLVTSREKIEPFSEMELGFLSEDEATRLFQKYHNRFSEEEVRQVVNDVEFHTLTIELLAKSAKKNRWEIETVRNAIIADAKAGVATSHSQYEKIERIKAYLIQIFKISGLDEPQEYILKQFTALPNQWIAYDQLSQLLQVKELDWKGDFSAALEILYEKGYVLKDGPTDSYKMHPVLVEALSPQLGTTLNDLKLLLESVTQLLYIDQTNDNPIDKFSYISFGDALLGCLSNHSTTEIAKLQNDLAVVYKVFGEYEKARGLLEQALASDRINYGDRHPTVARRQSNLALVYNDLGEYEKARELSEQALASEIANHGERHPAVVVYQSNLATVYQKLGEYEKARDLSERALESAIANYGERHSTVTIYRSNLATVYQKLGEYENARDILEQVVASDRVNYDEFHHVVAIGQSNLATVYQTLGEYDRARDLLKQALASDKANYGEHHPTVARRQSNLALVFRDLEEYEKARDLLEQALASSITFYGDQHPTVARRQSNLAAVYIELGEYEKARGLLEQALASDRVNYGEHHRSVAIGQSNLATVNQALGENGKAK